MGESRTGFSVEAGVIQARAVSHRLLVLECCPPSGEPHAARLCEEFSRSERRRQGVPHERTNNVANHRHAARTKICLSFGWARTVLRIRLGFPRANNYQCVQKLFLYSLNYGSDTQYKQLVSAISQGRATQAEASVGRFGPSRQPRRRRRLSEMARK